MRRYRQERRAEKTDANRGRILRAARRLFMRGGFHEVSIDAVAKAAKVGRTTVFEHFGSKHELLRAAVLEVAADAGVADLLSQLRSPDARVALKVAIEVGCRVWLAEREMFRRLEALAVYDVTLQKVMAEKDGGRQAEVVRLVDKLAAAGLLTVSRAEAYELMDAVTGFGAFESLYARTRSPARIAERLFQLTQAFVDVRKKKAS